MQIQRQSFGRLEMIKIENKLGNFIEIIPEMGCLLNAFQFNGKNIFDGYTSEQDLLDNFYSSYKGAFLSPYPNRIEEGKYSFGNQSYQLNMNLSDGNGNSIHGLIARAKYSLKKIIKKDSEVAISLSHKYNNTDPGFPFSYEIVKMISFSEADELKIRTKIINTSPTQIPMGDGWHPYFNTGSKVNDLDISFRATYLSVTNDKGIPTGETQPYNSFNQLSPIESTQFDDCFLLKDSSEGHITTLVDKSKDIKIEIWQDAIQRYLQIYTPPGRESIAIEPMTCEPNAFNSGQGLIVMNPNDEITLNMAIRVV